MQKVVTIIHTRTSAIKLTTLNEYEYPLIGKYLEEGYKVVQILPLTSSGEGAFIHSLTFVLEKS